MAGQARIGIVVELAASAAQQGPGSLAFAVDPGQIAGIVDGDLVGFRLSCFQLPFLNELRQKLRMMRDLKSSAATLAATGGRVARAIKTPVLVLHRVKAVRTSGDDLLHAVSLEGSEVAGRLLLEQEL